MDSNEYQQQAARTLIAAPDSTYTDEQMLLVWQALRLARASGSVIELIKKAVFHQHGLDRVELLKRIEYLHYCVGSFYAPDDDRVSLSDEQIMLVWNALGLSGEAGEIAALIGDSVSCRYGDRDALIKELGDTAWYIAALCTKIGVPLSDVMERNIEKLKVRYENGYSAAASKARVDK